jgi:hypothetical protein
MSLMQDLFSSGRIVDFILAVIVLESLVVIGLALVQRWHLPTVGMLMNLAAGAALLLALRSVLTDASWMVTGAWLGAAFLAHLADLTERFRTTRRLSGDASG